MVARAKAAEGWGRVAGDWGRAAEGWAVEGWARGLEAGATAGTPPRRHCSTPGLLETCTANSRRELRCRYCQWRTCAGARGAWKECAPAQQRQQQPWAAAAAPAPAHGNTAGKAPHAQKRRPPPLPANHRLGWQGKKRQHAPLTGRAGRYSRPARHCNCPGWRPRDTPSPRCRAPPPGWHPWPTTSRRWRTGLLGSPGCRCPPWCCGTAGWPGTRLHTQRGSRGVSQEGKLLGSVWWRADWPGAHLQEVGEAAQEVGVTAAAALWAAMGAARAEEAGVPLEAAQEEGALAGEAGALLLVKAAAAEATAGTPARRPGSTPGPAASCTAASPLG